MLDFLSKVMIIGPSMANNNINEHKIRYNPYVEYIILPIACICS